MRGVYPALGTLVCQTGLGLPLPSSHRGTWSSLQQEYQDLLFPGALQWLEQGIYNNFLLVNIQKAWEHAHVQALLSSFTCVFMYFYIAAA